MVEASLRKLEVPSELWRVPLRIESRNVAEVARLPTGEASLRKRDGLSELWRVPLRMESGEFRYDWSPEM
jgi:hypothetical protein